MSSLDASAQTKEPERPQHWDTCLLIAGPKDTSACSDLVLNECAGTETPAACIREATETWMSHYVNENLATAMRTEIEGALIGAGRDDNRTLMREMIAVTDAMVASIRSRGSYDRALALIVDIALKRHFASINK